MICWLVLLEPVETTHYMLQMYRSNSNSDFSENVPFRILISSFLDMCVADEDAALL